MTIMLASENMIWKAARDIQLQKEAKNKPWSDRDLTLPSTSELMRATGLKRGALMRILRCLLTDHWMKRWESSGKYFWEPGYPIHHSFFGWSMLHMETPIESDCSKCLHVKVCDRDMFKRCLNYEFGNSREKGCNSCIHNYTRFDLKEKVPCFYCEDELWETTITGEVWHPKLTLPVRARALEEG